MKFAYWHGFIVTAEDDGNISLNARVVCKADEVHDKLMTTLIEQANMFHESLRELDVPFDERRKP